MMPRVIVVMSTYNGEEYVTDQVMSILEQEDVDVSLYIRDDGSKDGTVRVLKELESEHSNIKVECGINIGFAKSFFTALKNCGDADYYAFSDQDDIWMSDKLCSTIELIKGKRCVLGYQNSWDTDQDLKNQVKHYDDGRTIPYFGMTFISSICSGYLMVFDKVLRDKAIQLDEICISHDLWVGAVASYLGTIQCGNECKALHRRLDSSVSINKPLKTFKHRVKSAISGVGVSEICSKQMLRLYGDQLDENKKKLLIDYSIYKHNHEAKRRLLFNPNIKYDMRGGWISIKLKIVLNRF